MKESPYEESQAITSNRNSPPGVFSMIFGYLPSRTPQVTKNGKYYHYNNEVGFILTVKFLPQVSQDWDQVLTNGNHVPGPEQKNVFPSPSPEKGQKLFG